MKKIDSMLYDGPFYLVVLIVVCLFAPIVFFCVFIFIGVIVAFGFYGLIAMWLVGIFVIRWHACNGKM